MKLLDLYKEILEKYPGSDQIEIVSASDEMLAIYDTVTRGSEFCQLWCADIAKSLYLGRHVGYNRDLNKCYLVVFWTHKSCIKK